MGGPSDKQVKELAKELASLRALCLAQVVLLGACLSWVYSTRRVQAQDSGNVLRVRGLIIEDSQGRSRVLLGAPFPVVPGRSRQDAPTQAMVFLDENGVDRLTLGETPDPQVGGKVHHRIARLFGVVIHDSTGDERGA